MNALARRNMIAGLAAAGGLALIGCAPSGKKQDQRAQALARRSGSSTPPAANTAATTGRQSLLASSSPANGATVAGPVNSLELRFSRPARLGEVTVTGSDGSKMPMMVNAVGEVSDYSLPLDGLGAGRYTVDWRATSAGIDYRGEIHFGVR